MRVWLGLVNTPPVNGRASRVRAARDPPLPSPPCPRPRHRHHAAPRPGLPVAGLPPSTLRPRPRRRRHILAWSSHRPASPSPRPRGPPEPPRRRRCLAFARGHVAHTPRAAAGPQVALSVATSPPRRAPLAAPQVAHRGCAPLHS